jgi:hypothetical protein
MISTITGQIELTITDLAKAFVQMDAENQASFFEECNRIAGDSWGALSAQRQWILVGEALGNGGPAP